MGVNQIVGEDPKRIIQDSKTAHEKYDEVRNKFKENPFGDGKALEKIVEILKSKL